jgi:hypothetical protein
MTPAFDAVGAIVLNARPTDIRTVLVNGRVVKRDGALVGVDWPVLRTRFQASSECIMAGFRTVDVAEMAAAARAAFPHLE